MGAPDARDARARGLPHSMKHDKECDDLNLNGAQHIAARRMCAMKPPMQGSRV